MRGPSRDTLEREKNNGVENCAKFHIQLGNGIKFYHQKMLPIFNCIFSPWTFAYFLYHLIYFCLRKIKKMHVEINGIE